MEVTPLIVTTRRLADEAVTAEKIAVAAVTAAKIAKTGDGALALTGAVAEGCGVASGSDSHAEGAESRAYLDGQHAQGAGMFANAGDAQHSRIVLHQAVTHDDINWHSIGAGALQAIPVDTLWTFDILLSGMSVSGVKLFSYRFTGLMFNTGTGLTCPAVTTTPDAIIYESEAAFDAQVVVDDPSEALSIEVKGSLPGGEVVRWVADVRLCEVGFPTA